MFYSQCLVKKQTYHRLIKFAHAQYKTVLLSGRSGRNCQHIARNKTRTTKFQTMNNEYKVAGAINSCSVDVVVLTGTATYVV